MSDFFKSALGYFNPGQNGGIGGPADDDFVGQIVEVGTVKLHVKRLIAEGNTITIIMQRALSCLSLWADISDKQNALSN